MPVVFAGTGSREMKKMKIMKGMKIMKEMNCAKRGKHHATPIGGNKQNITVNNASQKSA
jgi:hypothetical protein